MGVVAEILTFLERRQIDLNPGTWGWVTLTRFGINAPAADTELLAALIGHPKFRGLPYDLRKRTEEEKREWAAIRERFIERARAAGHSVQIWDEEPVPDHGPYQLSAISVSSYRRTTAAEAQEELERAAAEYDSPEPTVLAELEAKVFPLLRAPSLYQLTDLPQEAEHEHRSFLYAFREFVSINGLTSELVLIMAGYD